MEDDVILPFTSDIKTLSFIKLLYKTVVAAPVIIFCFISFKLLI